MKHLILLLLLIPYVSFSSYKSVNEEPIKVKKEKVKSISVGNIETLAVDGCSGAAAFIAVYDPLNCCWSFQNTTTNDCMQWNCTWDFGDGSPPVSTRLIYQNEDTFNCNWRECYAQYGISSTS